MNSSNKTISILISAYNDAEYLERCFESLLKQTYKDFEIIFRDNDSSDDSYSVALSYRKIFQKNGIYLFTDLNKRRVHRYKCDRMCIEESEGGYLYNLNPKCILACDALERIMNFFEANESIGGLMIGNSAKKYFSGTDTKTAVEKEKISNWILQGGKIRHSNLVVKRVASIPIEGLQSAYTFWDDTEKTFLLSCFSDIGIMNEEIFSKEYEDISSEIEVFFERYILNYQMLRIAEQLKIDPPDTLKKSFAVGMENLAKHSLEQAKKAADAGKKALNSQYVNMARIFDEKFCKEQGADSKEFNVMKALILAAGAGTRLAPLTDRCPKALVQVNGKPIIIKQIENLHENGITDITIISGYKRDILEREIHKRWKEINIVESKDYAVTNNMFSAYIGRDMFYNEPFLMMNADVFFDESVITEILHCPYTDAIVTDIGAYLEESMKVVEKDGRLVEISKKIKPEDALGASIDVYKFSAEGGRAFFDKCAEYIEVKKELRMWSEVALNDILDKVEFHACPLKGRWFEIDTYEDLLEAEKLF